MKSFDINADLRKKTGKKSSVELRKDGLIPCVLYGGKENVHFAAKKSELRHILYTPDVYLVNIILDNAKHICIIKDAQFHPVTDEPVHIDFKEVWEDKPAIVSLPIKLQGSSEGVRAGGKLHQRRRYLKAKSLLKDLPEEFIVDISSLKIGDHISIGDLKYPNVELLDPAKSMVVGVSTSRIAKGMEETEMGVVTPAEGVAEEVAEESSAADSGKGKEAAKE